MLGVFGIIIGYTFAKILRLHPRNARTVALGDRDPERPLAIAIIVLTFPARTAAIGHGGGALYSLFIVMTSTLFTLIFRRANTAAEQKIPDSLL
jgi:BASS family bile acid:Na+ symporter